jgi:hypothetical protein
MKQNDRVAPDRNSRASQLTFLAWGSCAAVLLSIVAFAIFQVLVRPDAHQPSSGDEDPGADGSFRARQRRAPPVFQSRVSRPGAGSPDQLVAERLAQFARSRRAFAQALAKRHGVAVPDTVEHFFAAVESGDWDRIQRAFERINGGDSTASQTDRRAPGVAEIWPAIIDAYGVAEQVHLWPAQQLLDYGNSILGALRPGMVYVGGTDEGRWIPELLNDTSGGDRHIIITQNALAAGDYEEYLRLQYDGRFSNVSDEETQAAFDAYVKEAQKRLEHDRQFPEEPKQIRPGEDVQILEGKVQVGGAVAVMGINELLLKALMQKNPDLSFAIQQSFPFQATYATAMPLGPLMELGAVTQEDSFSPEHAEQGLNYWREVAQHVLDDPQASTSEAALKSYSHNVVSTANLLAAHHFTDQAAQAYELGNQLWPGNPESVSGLADLLISEGRQTEARQLLDDFSQKYPDQRQSMERLSAAWHLSWTATTAPR